MVGGKEGELFSSLLLLLLLFLALLLLLPLLLPLLLLLLPQPTRTRLYMASLHRNSRREERSTLRPSA